jgi:prepilin-type N-terminal cleavage/methylation domain-containing protein
MSHTKHTGFTLIELLIGITITVMIFLTTSSVFLLFYSADARTKRIQTLEQAKNDVQQDLSSAIRWARVITWDAAAKTLTLDSSTVYSLVNNKLTKNSTSLVPRDVDVRGFTVTDLSTLGSYKSYEITIDLGLSQSPTSTDRLRVVAPQRKLVIEENGNPGGGPRTRPILTCTPGNGGGNNGGGGGPGPGR